MKYYIFKHKDKNKDFRTKKLNTKRIIKISIVVIILIVIAGLLFEYKTNEQFREFFDVKILRKEISNENTVKIDISSKTSPNVYTYYKYITILDRNLMEVYTNSSKPDFKLDVTITNPIYADNNRFLCVAEKSGKKVYLISGQNIIWQKDIDGEITKVNLNKNGYVAIVTSNSGYKTIITLYNPNGEELFKTYLPTTYAADVEISTDNKYLAIGEINTSGATIQTGIRIISIENAKTNPEEAFLKKYETDNKGFITNLKYNDKNKLVCMYNDRIVDLADEAIELQKIESNMLFSDVDLNNHLATVSKQVGGVLRTDYYIKIKNLNTLKENSYKLNSVPKAVNSSDNIVAINYGTEVDIINSNAWLIRRYKSSLQEIRDVSISDNIVAVIYKDKVEIINL